MKKIDVRVADFTHLDMTLLTIMGIRDEYAKPIGSGVMIGPNIAVTAWHVFEEFYKTFHEGEIQLLGNRQFVGNVNIFKNPKFTVKAFAHFMTDGEMKSLEFNMMHAHVSHLSDLVVLTLEPSPQNFLRKLPCRRIRAYPPTKGVFVDAFGYVCPEEGKITKIDFEPYAARGMVVDIFESGLDKALYYSPGFQMDALIKPGMSGGPVYTQNGRLCGIICGSGSEVVSDENIKPPLAYISSIYPLLGCRLILDLPGRLPNISYSLQELGRIGLLSIQGGQRYNLTFDNEGVCYEITAFFRRD